MNKKHVIIAALLGIAGGLGIAKAICWMKAKKEAELKAKKTPATGLPNDEIKK